MKIATVIGARPQFVKAAAVSRLLAARDGDCELLIHTGQHYDPEMSAIFFSDLGIPEPACNLGIGSGGHGDQTGRMMISLEPVLLRERPDLLLVYGDTNSTLAGALTAAKLQIPVAHVEAGLRSFNRRMPEEINRELTDRLSRWLFCPTPAAVNNLANEGIRHGVIHTGDVMFDVHLLFAELAEKRSTVLADQGLRAGEFFLATLHRAENTDAPGRLRGLFAALGDLGLSSIANVLGAIKYAKYMALGPDDIVLTVATDGAEMYHSEIEIARANQFAGGFSEVEAAQAFGQHLLGAATDHVSELTRFDRERIFNLGYYTWVEQQGTRLSDFDARRDQGFWDGLMDLVPIWDAMTEDLNAAVS